MTKSSDFQILKFVLIIFLGWKAIITLTAFFGLSFFPIIQGDIIGLANPRTDFWINWANWDGGHFKGIAENGYLKPYQVVFFPFYPLLIKSLMLLNIPALWGGMIISNFFIIATLFYLYKLVNLDFEENISKRAVFITLAFPTAFYFSAVYSESLFLFLTVATFYSARKKRMLIACLLASLSAVTRFMGLVVILAIAFEYFLKTDKLPTIKEYWSDFLNRIVVYLLLLAVVFSIIPKLFFDKGFYLLAGFSKSIPIFLTDFALILLCAFISKFLFKHLDFKKFLTLPGLFFLLSLLPFLSYCLFLYLSQNSFLAFVNQEKYWERQFTLPWIAPLNYFNYLFDTGFFKIANTAQVLIEFMFFVFFFILLIFSYLKFRLSYTIYFALSLLIPVTTGTFQAIHRYGLVIFPVFMLLALIKNESYYHLWLFFSLTLLGILTILFINNYWVS